MLPENMAVVYIYETLDDAYLRQVNHNSKCILRAPEPLRVQRVQTSKTLCDVAQKRNVDDHVYRVLTAGQPWTPPPPYPPTVRAVYVPLSYRTCSYTPYAHRRRRRRRPLDFI